MIQTGECFLCKENTLVEKINNKYICEKCFEKIELMNAASEGIDIWINETIRFHGKYDECIDNTIKGYVSEIERKNISVAEQEQELLNMIREEVEVRLRFYRQDELFLVFFAIKEYIGRYCLVTQNPDWIYLGDIPTISFMMKVINNISCFENSFIQQLKNGCSNLANAICWARRYVLITNNISILTKKEHHLNDVWYEAVQNNYTEKYYDIYLKNGIFEKPEDYVIHEPVLKSRLESDKKTPDKILEKLDDLLLEELGINIQILDGLVCLSLKKEFQDKNNFEKWKREGKAIYKQELVVFIEKQKLSEVIGEVSLENILNLFSINRNIDKDEKYLELFCFYEISDIIVFGNIDFTQTINIFKKLLLSGHFMEIFKKGLSGKREIVQAQRAISKYFSYCVADLLYQNGYELPIEIYEDKPCIRAEIGHIIVNGNNLLVDRENKLLGDIDVLAINSLKKEILLFELKYYRPALEYKEMILRDKSMIIDKEVIRHIKERESVIALNANEVVKFVKGKEESGYSVKSLLITPRTNYYGICQGEVEYLTWNQLCKAVEEKSL